MRLSKLAAALVVVLSFFALAGALTTLVLTALEPAIVVVLALVVIAVGGVSALGVRSRRWLSNPYW